MEITIKDKWQRNSIWKEGETSPLSRCIDSFTTECLEAEHRAYFNTLYTGTTQVLIKVLRGNIIEYLLFWLQQLEAWVCKIQFQVIVDLCQVGQYQTGEYLQILVVQFFTPSPVACSNFKSFQNTCSTHHVWGKLKLNMKAVPTNTSSG